MICIAESGSTKTDWVVLDITNNLEKRFVSKGLNPFYVTQIDVAETINKTFPHQLIPQIDSVFFYGAGCSSDLKKSIIETGLTKVFLKADISVEHDMLAAARSTARTSKGVVSILGTGSNSCKFDGDCIIDSIDNLGFILGDEGSGGAIGRALIRARYYREMPADLEYAFDTKFGVTRDDILDRVHYSDEPNMYVASFSPFCTDQLGNPFVQDLLKACFEEFITRHLLKYKAPDWTYHFVGSIAHHYSDELNHVMDVYNLNVGSIIKQPIDKLVEYHKSKE